MGLSTSHEDYKEKERRKRGSGHLSPERIVNRDKARTNATESDFMKKLSMDCTPKSSKRNSMAAFDKNQISIHDLINKKTQLNTQDNKYLSRYYFICQENLEDSFFYDIDLSEEADLTCRGLQKKINTCLASAGKKFCVNIKLSYFGQVNPERDLLYYKDSSPFYYETQYPSDVYVKTGDGKVFKISVLPDDSFENFKIRVSHQTLIPFDHIVLLTNTSDQSKLKNIPQKDDLCLAMSNTPFKIDVETVDHKVVSVEVRPYDRIRKIRRNVREKLGSDTTTMRLCCNGVALYGRNRVKDYEDIQKLGVLQISPSGEAGVQLFTKTLSGKKITLDVKYDYLVETIKAIIKEKEGTPIDKQFLICCGKYLKDGYIFEECGMVRDCTLHMMRKLHGESSANDSGLPFVEVSNQQGIKKKEFLPNAPLWRRCTTGLNIEGKCINSTCEAFGKMVIIRVGFATFDLILDQDKCVCPMCESFVAPVSCGLTNCMFTISGIKNDVVNKTSIKIFMQNWEEVGDVYLYYDPQKSGRANWVSLKIHCKKEDKVKIACGICAKQVEATIAMDCGHLFHDECLGVLGNLGDMCLLCNH